MKRTPLKRGKAPRRKTSARGMKQKLDLQVREAVLERDCYKCAKCGKPQGEIQLQAAHVFCKGRWSAMRFIEDNVMALCGGCHRWWHDQPTESGHWFRTEFAERYDLLKQLSFTAPKITKAQLKRMAYGVKVI